MIKRDAIFYSACGLGCVGAVFAILGHSFSLLFFVGAILLRPALHEFGLARKFADERQHEIYARSGNLAFVVLMIALAGMTLWEIAHGGNADAMYTLIGIGVATRVLSTLIMNGEYRKAGVLIITAAGVFVAIFITLVEGVSAAAAGGAVLGLLIIGLGQLARKLPRTIAVTLGLLAAIIVITFRMLDFRQGPGMAMWIFLIFPLLAAAICLFLGSRVDETVSPRRRSIAFGSLGAVAATVFALTLIFGRGEAKRISRTKTVPAGEITQVQDVSCTGDITYYANGGLKSCVLACDDTLSGQPLPPGTIVCFKEDSTFDFCFLQQTTEIQGLPCRGGGHDFMTCFHPNGQLRLAWLADDMVIQGVPCARFRFLTAFFGAFNGKSGGTSFYPNGQLKYCELSENATIKGRRFRKGDGVRFDDQGNLLATR